MMLYEQEAGAGTWVEKKSMPHIRIDSAIVAAEGMINNFGGWSNGSTISDLIERYDPDSDTWVEMGRMTEPKWAMGAVYLSGKFYLIGGKTTGWMDETGGCIDTVEELTIN